MGDFRGSSLEKGGKKGGRKEEEEEETEEEEELKVPGVFFVGNRHGAARPGVIFEGLAWNIIEISEEKRRRWRWCGGSGWNKKRRVVFFVE